MSDNHTPRSVAWLLKPRRRASAGATPASTVAGSVRARQTPPLLRSRAEKRDRNARLPLGPAPSRWIPHQATLPALLQALTYPKTHVGALASDPATRRTQ